MEVRESEDVVKFLAKGGLVSQYKNKKTLIQSGHPALAQLKKMEPKSNGIFYFRINKQYRAIGFRDGNILVVTEIWDHS